MQHRSLLLLVATAFASASSAQLNTKGSIHVGAGLAFAGHATQYEQTLIVGGLQFHDQNDDGAASVTVPLQFNYAFADIFSLGVFLEPGSYLDSTDSQFNNLIVYGLQPRFYVVNKDRFAWMASLQLGGASLKINDEDPFGQDTEARYAGSFFGISTGPAFSFGDLVGLDVDLRYMAANFTLREYSIEGDGVDLDNFDAELRTRGFGVQVSLMFRL